MGYQVLGAGSRARVAKHLHREPGDHLGHGHCLVIRLPAGQDVLDALSHHVQGLLGHACHALAVVLAGDERSHLPVRDGGVFGEDIRDAADPQELGRPGDDVQVRDDEGRGGHRYGLLLPVDDDGADVGGEAVRGREGGYGDEGDAQLVGGVTGEVHERTAADCDDDIGVVELRDDGLDHVFLGVEALGLEDNLLVCRDVDHARKVIGVGVVEDGAPAREAALTHVLVKILKRPRLDYHQLGLQRMLPPAGARPGVLCAV